MIPTEQGAAALAAFGGWLVRERELRGLSRADVAKATRLTATAIEGIESGDPARTPHRAYAVVYLRGYAAAVGLDPDDVILRYEEAVGPAADAGGGAPRAASSGRALRVALAAGALLAAALAILALRGR